MNPKFSLFLSELSSSRNVLSQLIFQQLILRYRRTALGYLWTLINPLLMMSIMAMVFSTLFKADLKSFAVFLFAGMIPWNFFSAVITQSGASFINNEGLIKKIYLPKVIFPLKHCVRTVNRQCSVISGFIYHHPDARGITFRSDFIFTGCILTSVFLCIRDKPYCFHRYGVLSRSAACHSHTYARPVFFNPHPLQAWCDGGQGRLAGRYKSCCSIHRTF